MKTPDNGRPQNPEQLIGGFATGSLSPAEQQALLENALRDQALFDELMKEQALKEMLDEPGVRRELTAVLGETNPSFVTRLKRWMHSPIAWSAAGAVAAAAVLSVAVWRADKPMPVVMESKQAVSQPAPPAQTAPPAEPVPVQKERAAAPPPAKPLPARQMAAEIPQPDLPKAEVQVQATQSAPAPAVVGEMRDLAVAAAPPPPPPPPMAASNRELARAEAKAAAPALDYGILRGDAEGVFRPVASVRDLKDGDRFKVTITPSQPGPLQVFRRARDGSESAIFAANVPAGATVIVPSGTALRMGESSAVILQFGRGPELLRQPQFGFRAPSGGGQAPPPARADKATAESEAAPVRIEINLLR